MHIIFVADLKTLLFSFNHRVRCINKFKQNFQCIKNTIIQRYEIYFFIFIDTSLFSFSSYRFQWLFHLRLILRNGLWYRDLNIWGHSLRNALKKQKMAKFCKDRTRPLSALYNYSKIRNLGFNYMIFFKFA